jgi:DNA helicase IV
MNNTTKMTLTERNQKLYELRKKMDKLNAELAWVKQEIWMVKDQYERQDLDLFEEMFGEKNTLWDHLDRMRDTPMAEEIYGG